ncbi:hypothetical protein ACIBG7_03150 [Nonomuraea sp. NPDC050328]|uniref:hypothetical protein n=1 Tax=Nonomuraea sp. NPDC050328 TaxID=3364361 RepID=UPI00378785E9
MTTEEKLAQALRTIADRAENRDVLPGVLAKRRLRARRRATGALAGIVAVAMAWGVLALRPRSPVVTGPPPPDAGSIERVWPQAVFTMPKGPRVLAAINATEVLIWNERGTLEVYDAVTRRSRIVATLAEAPQYRTVDGDRVLWLADGHAWVAPLRGGGKPTKVGPITGENVDRIALAGEHVIWSSPLNGVWRMSVKGGRPERVARSKGLQLVEWPWATDEPLDVRTNPTRVVNLVTGQRIKIRPVRGVERLRCGPAWCVGSRGQDTVVQRTDGSWSRVHRGGMPDHPYRGRLFLGSGEIYDASTDTTVTFKGAERAGGGRHWYGGTGVLFWPRGDALVVINLAAIP